MPIGKPSAPTSAPWIRTACPGRPVHLLLAGCCPPPRSPVRPLSNALRAFNAQWPWAPCESGLERPPRVDRSSGKPPLMMYLIDQRAASCLIPCPAIAQHSESRSAAGRCGVFPVSARIYRQRNSTCRSPDKPHGCWVLRPEFTVNVGIALTANFSRERYATFIPSDLPSD